MASVEPGITTVGVSDVPLSFPDNQVKRPGRLALLFDTTEQQAMRLLVPTMHNLYLVGANNMFGIHGWPSKTTLLRFVALHDLLKIPPGEVSEYSPDVLGEQVANLEGEPGSAARLIVVSMERLHQKGYTSEVNFSGLWAIAGHLHNMFNAQRDVSEDAPISMRVATTHEVMLRATSLRRELANS